MRDRFHVLNSCLQNGRVACQEILDGTEANSDDQKVVRAVDSSLPVRPFDQGRMRGCSGSLRGGICPTQEVWSPEVTGNSIDGVTGMLTA